MRWCRWHAHGTSYYALLTTIITIIINKNVIFKIIFNRKSQRIKSSHQKFLELISDYVKITGYKVNIQKSNYFQYVSNEQLEFEIKNTTPFTLTPKNEILRYKSNMYKIYTRKTTKC